MSTQFRKRVLVTFFSLAILLLSGCSKKTENVGQNHEGVELNLAIWANYISPEMVKKFTDETGIKLNISNYSSNEDLLAKIQSGAANIDVAVPSDYMVEILAKQGLLSEIDKAKLPNLTGVEESLLNLPFDSGNKFSIPYAWGTTGIAVNRELYQGKIESWKDVFENEALKGKVSLMDDVREVMGAALKFQGASLNSTNPAELNKAKEILLKARKNIKLFNSDSIDILINKEVAVAHAYSSDALNAWNKTQGKIEFILPKEGVTRSVDNVVILKNSKKVEAAHKLLNFMLSEEANVNFVSTQFGGPVLKNTRGKLSDKLKNNNALFPAKEFEKKMEAIVDLGEKTTLYDEIWMTIKTGN